MIGDPVYACKTESAESLSMLKYAQMHENIRFNLQTL